LPTTSSSKVRVEKGEKQTLKTATKKVMQEVGVDPTYNNTLAYYPLEAGDQTIDNTP